MKDYREDQPPPLEYTVGVKPPPDFRPHPKEVSSPFKPFFCEAVKVNVFRKFSVQNNECSVQNKQQICIFL